MADITLQQFHQQIDRIREYLQGDMMQQAMVILMLTNPEFTLDDLPEDGRSYIICNMVRGCNKIIIDNSDCADGVFELLDQLLATNSAPATFSHEILTKAIQLPLLFKIYAKYVPNQMLAVVLKDGFYPSVKYQLAKLTREMPRDKLLMYGIGNINDISFMKDLEIFLNVAKLTGIDIYRNVINITALNRTMTLRCQHLYLIENGFKMPGCYWTVVNDMVDIAGKVFPMDKNTIAASRRTILLTRDRYNQLSQAEYNDLVYLMLQYHVPIDNTEVDGILYQLSRFHSVDKFLPTFLQWDYEPSDFTPLWLEIAGGDIPDDVAKDELAKLTEFKIPMLTKPDDLEYYAELMSRRAI